MLLPSVLGNPPQHPRLVHAAFPEHAVAAGGTLSACRGRDVVSLRPVQVTDLWVRVGACGGVHLGRGGEGTGRGLELGH